MKIFKRLNCVPFIVSITFVFGSSVLFAEETPTVPTLEAQWNAATEEALSNEINRIGEEIRNHVDLSNATKRKLEFIWNDPSYTSEAVETKRKNLKEAEEALIKAQIELRAEITKLPEVQKISTDNEKLQSTINALRLKNTALVKLLRSRKQSKNSGN